MAHCILDKFLGVVLPLLSPKHILRSINFFQTSSRWRDNVGRKTKRIVGYPLQKLLCERASVLRHTYIACLVYYVSAVWSCSCSVIGRICECTQYREMCRRAVALRWSVSTLQANVRCKIANSAPCYSNGVLRNFLRGGSTNCVEDRENGDLGALAP